MEITLTPNQHEANGMVPTHYQKRTLISYLWKILYSQTTSNRHIYMLLVFVNRCWLLIQCILPTKGEVVWHLTSSSLMTWPRMYYEQALHSLSPPMETRVLLLSTIVGSPRPLLRTWYKVEIYSILCLGVAMGWVSMKTAHRHILVGIRTNPSNVDGIWRGRVCMCQPTTLIFWNPGPPINLLLLFKTGLKSSNDWYLYVKKCFSGCMEV